MKSAQEDLQTRVAELEGEIERLRADSARGERALDAALSHTPDCISVWDLDCRIVYANRAVLNLWQRSLEEVIGKDRHELGYPPELASLIDRQIRHVIETGRQLREESPFTGPTGEMRHYEYFFTPIFDRSGKVEAVVGSSRDVTDAKRMREEEEKARERLRATEERLVFALEAAGAVGAWDWDLQRDLLHCNERFAKLFSVDPARAEAGVSSSAFIESIHPDDRKAVTEKVQQAVETVGAYAADFRVRQKDGSERWVYALGRAYRDVEGKPSRLPGVVIDITERKEMERALRRTEEFNRRVLESTRDCIKILDRDAGLLFMNRQSQRELGIEDLEPYLHTSWLNFWEDPADRAAAEAAVERARMGLEGQFEGYCATAGEPRWWDVRVTPINDAEGRTERLLAVCRDITERKQADERERERVEQVRESARLESLGIMAGGIAHDFNNLLTGILGNASLLGEHMPDVNGSIASQIVLAAERAADLTQQMLAFSGKGRFVIEVLDLNTLVQENLTLLRATLSRTVSVELELGSGKYLTEVDGAQIQQVVMNLLINASEAMGDGPGRVAIRTARTELAEARFSAQIQATVPAGRYVLLEVRDNGSGMPPETLKKIFDPFFTTKFTGRGLGLAAVLGIVKGHQGDIEVESEPGAGTTFRILLPASDGAGSPQREPEFATARAATGQTVLVVDDEEIVRRMAAMALQSRGFRVVQAANGLEALEILRHQSDISLVILDLTMPVMTGEQAIPLIQAIRPEIAIILSSGFSETEISSRFASVGISGVLQKPYTVSGIISKVAHALKT